MKNAPVLLGRGARYGRQAWAGAIIIPFPDSPQQPDELRVSDDLARLARLTRSPADRRRLGRHRRRMAAYRMRRCA